MIRSLTALKDGDFDGLTGLEWLNLELKNDLGQSAIGHFLTSSPAWST